MSDLDNILTNIRHETVSQSDGKAQIQYLLEELVDRAYSESSKMEQRKDQYERGSRLRKRILKKEIWSL